MKVLFDGLFALKVKKTEANSVSDAKTEWIFTIGAFWIALILFGIYNFVIYKYTT